MAVQMCAIITIVIFFLVANSLQKVHFYQERIEESVRFRFVYAALRPYYEETRTVFVFARDTEFFEGFLPVVPVILINEWDTLTKVMTDKTGSLIVILNGDSADRNFNDLKQLRRIRTNAPVLVACYNSVECSSDMYLTNFAESINSPLMHYAAIDEEGSVQLFARTTTSEGSCGVPRLVKDTYEDGVKWPNHDTFHARFNFNKCPIRLATCLIASTSRPCEPGNPHHFCGVEGEIVEVFVNKINATPVSTILECRTVHTDLQTLFAEERMDLAYVRLRIDSNKIRSYSMQYMYVKATIIVPHSASVARVSLLTMVQPLSPEVWIGFGVVLASMIILCLIVSYFRRLSALQQFGLILGISAPIQPQQNPQRIYFFSIVLFGFLISQAYLVNLTKIYSASNPHYIKTLEELEELGLQIYGDNLGKEILKQYGYSRIAENNYKVLEPEVQTSKVIKAVTGQSSDPVYGELNLEAISSWKNFEFMEQTVRMYSIALAVPNSSLLIRPANRVILFMVESGLLRKPSTTKSTDNVTYSYMSIRTAKQSDSNESHGPKKLSLKDLQGVFLLLVGASGLSFCCFLVELAVCMIKKKYSKQRDGFARKHDRNRIEGLGN